MTITADHHTEDSRSNPISSFFGVIVSPRTYGALAYMLLSLVTGIFYFTWVVTGFSLSLGLMVLIIGIPFAILFMFSVRGIAFIERHIVHIFLGTDMSADEKDEDEITENEFSESEAESEEGKNRFFAYLKTTFTDGRTYSAMFYMMLLLALGIVYFTIAVTGLSVGLTLIIAPALVLLGFDKYVNIDFGDAEMNSGILHWVAANPDNPLMLGVMMVIGFLVFFLTLHLARGIGTMHGKLAHALLPR